MLEKRTEEDNNHFTLDDIYTALDCYNEKYVRFPRKDLERITGVSMPANKRNGRKQKEHINMMNMIRDVINKNVDWNKKGNGRPQGSGTKENIVKEYRKNNSTAKKIECYRDTGLSRITIDKYW